MPLPTSSTQQGKLVRCQLAIASVVTGLRRALSLHRFPAMRHTFLLLYRYSRYRVQIFKAPREEAALGGWF